MARVRLARRAAADISRILAASTANWGAAARTRYSRLLSHAIRRVAAEPEAPASRDRAELAPGLRSLNLRNLRPRDSTATVRRPVHVLYYRVLQPDLIEIVRVLHERMEPSRHLSDDGERDE
jgi:toxin ParE1/3/4